jgi:quinol monooxygenase YgiN
MIVVFRSRTDDFEKFMNTVRKHKSDIHAAGAKDIWAHRNRKHPNEIMLVESWPDKATFDKFAEGKGKDYDKEAGVKWTDVSTWEEVDV